MAPQDRINDLQRQLALAKAREDYEKCAEIKEQIDRLEEEQREALSLRWDHEAYYESLKQAESKTQSYLQQDAFDKCAKLKKLKQQVEELKLKFDNGDVAIKKQSLEELKQLASDIASM